MYLNRRMIETILPFKNLSLYESQLISHMID